MKPVEYLDNDVLAYCAHATSTSYLIINNNKKLSSIKFNKTDLNSQDNPALRTVSCCKLKTLVDKL